MWIMKIRYCSLSSPPAHCNYRNSFNIIHEKSFYEIYVCTLKDDYVECDYLEEMSLKDLEKTVKEMD